ncbi:hypothetical protein N8I71_09400 [Roseibacterium sp. SDUM158016]|uniref:hypothetical protein n=1 Tax=Roseicyclus sediminis TaxID=2980997 RepID=UPI0021D0D7D7|nr:hypothetical protein [Roseibacterium sp. SDUM158016]MCU4653047.1 hypothetical protein [Roseibacterium sp. SDUM158016]
MFWALITAVVAGFAGAGIGLLLRSLSRKRLPQGIIPICAGLAMLAATVGTEYGWYPNVLRNMAADTVVVSTREQQTWYQPWTYVRPWVRGFIAYSPSETVETAPGSGIQVVQIRRQERWQPQFVLPVLVDCDGARRAEITPSTTFTETGAPVDAGWLSPGRDDPILNSVCSGGAAGG